MFKHVIYIYIYIYIYICIYIYIFIYIIIYIFTTEDFFEVAIEVWPEWDLNPQTTGFCSDALTD